MGRRGQGGAAAAAGCPPAPSEGPTALPPPLTGRPAGAALPSPALAGQRVSGVVPQPAVAGAAAVEGRDAAEALAPSFAGLSKRRGEGRAVLGRLVGGPEVDGAAGARRRRRCRFRFQARRTSACVPRLRRARGGPGRSHTRQASGRVGRARSAPPARPAVASASVH